MDLRDINKKLSDLALAVYRVTGLFPEGEASRHRIRERAMEILEDATFYVTIREKDVSGKAMLLQTIEAKISALLGMFRVVRAQHYVKELNFDILEWEYREVEKAIQEELARDIPEIQSSEEGLREEAVYKIETGAWPQESIADVLSLLNGRQQQLVGFFKDNGSARLRELTKLFPDVSEKTIRNDLKVLCEKHLLRFNGKAPQSYYSLR